ncbi:MAG TPA: hypothetical protein VK899_07010, partial [Gemmatimonadales bacterium]|nr:hypothetical protein [Gemmatimonadales bacterium]
LARVRTPTIRRTALTSLILNPEKEPVHRADSRAAAGIDPDPAAKKRAPLGSSSLEETSAKKDLPNPYTQTVLA